MKCLHISTDLVQELRKGNLGVEEMVQPKRELTPLAENNLHDPLGFGGETTYLGS